ncbi:MAG TPA: efflux RND transporter periplasmic adaptor subunit [Gallionella sp.]|nr:efflux RND transporter periplasmic adaptor subunit [Gallionella sp.]
MKNIYLIFIAVLLGVAAGSYWLGLKGRIEDRGSRVAAKSERPVLYYRNPMGLPDTSPVPKKDAMGMDYVPVYEGESAADGAIDIGSDKVQKLGVKSEPAALRVLEHKLRAVGRIEIDERRSYTVAPKFEGWVERLYVNTTGQMVVKGQPLFEVYSPELVSAQREHALAVQGVADMKDADGEARDSMKRLADASAARLRNWDVGGASGGKTVTFHAPVSGIVLEKKAVQGVRFMPGEMLYQIADLSSVWVMADVAEQDIASIKLGDAVRVGVDAYPAQRFDGKVDFIYPTLNSATRTVSLRVVIPNSQGLLKPSMFASVELATGKSDKVLSVPISAVIDSGTRQVVLVRLAEGRFAPREVKTGRRGDAYVEVLAGIAEGEQVVTSANFLIDAESNLRAALGGLGGVTAAAEPSSQPAVPDKKSASVGHQGQGKFNEINEDGSVSITHEPIASLGWPGMTMDFALANSALTKGIQPGSAIRFEIVERAKGEWVITQLQAAPQKHEGH